MIEPTYTPAMRDLSPQDQVEIARVRERVTSRLYDHPNEVTATAVPRRRLVVLGAFRTAEQQAVTLLCDADGNVVPYTPGWRWAEACEPRDHLRIIQRAIEIRASAADRVNDDHLSGLDCESDRVLAG